MSARAWLVAVIASTSMAGTACGGSSEDGSSSRTSSAAAASTVELDVDALDVPSLLAALPSRHAQFVAVLGPHRIEYTLEVKTEPTPPPPELPAPGTRVVDPWSVTDQVALVWTSPASAAPEFHFEQTNDHERGQELLVVDNTLYNRQRHRAWTQRPAETDAYELVLDETARAVRDVLEFAAPQLALEAESLSDEGPSGENLVEVRLSATPRGTRVETISGAGRKWRESAVFESIDGTVRLDPKTGIWLHADVTVRYALSGPNDTSVKAMSRLTARAKPLENDVPAVKPPEGAEPVFERTRYAEERKRLLDGLAAP